MMRGKLYSVRLLQNAGDLRTEQRSRFEVFNLDSAKVQNFVPAPPSGTMDYVLQVSMLS